MAWCLQEKRIRQKGNLKRVVILQEVLPRRTKGELENSKLNVSSCGLKNCSVVTVLLVLQIFFEGVQECIAAGVKEDEVGYQLAFSKQELRKCIKEYPAKELKKGLEQLYKKVEKHLCEEENLLQVILSLQDYFRDLSHTYDSSVSLGMVEGVTRAFSGLSSLKDSHTSFGEAVRLFHL